LRRMGADETCASKDYDMLQDSAVLLRQGLG
jgi:hypothetical protein